MSEATHPAAGAWASRRVPSASPDAVLRAFVKTWRAGHLSDEEVLATLRGLPL